MSVEIFYSPKPRANTRLTVEEDGKIHYFTETDGANINEILPIEDAIRRWPLYANEIKKAVEACRSGTCSLRFI